MENEKENKPENNFFDFLPENSVIIYKKFKFNYKGLNASDFSIKNSRYHFDSYNNQFIHFIGDLICVFNSKGEWVEKLKYPKLSNEKIRQCTCDSSNINLLIITEKNKLYILNLKKGYCSEYHSDKAGPLTFIHGGFFIPNKSKNKEDKKKETEEFNIGIISNNSYRIVNVALSGKNFLFKDLVVSDSIPITEFYFNNIFNVLITRNEYKGFYLMNLKNSHCFNSRFDLKINNVYFTSKFYIQNIYNKLYFIHFTEDLIEFYRLNNIKKNKEPKKIVFNRSKKSYDYELAQMQFYNNLIILYLGDNIRIYDLKAGLNKKVGKVDVPMRKSDGFFDKLKILGKFVFIKNDIYKIKFLPEICQKENVSNTFETFFTLIRRKNSINPATKLLKNLIEQYELSVFHAILSKLVQNYIRAKKEIINDDSKNANEMIYIGHNFFYISQDDIFSLFNDDFNNIENLKLLQLMITVYNVYEKNKIPVDKDVFISALFYQLNKTDDFTILDLMIKNKVIPVNKKLGLYLVDRAKYINDREKRNLAFTLGIEILLDEDENIDDVLYELIDEEKFDESINIITDFYFGYSYKADKKNKDIKGDINKHLRKFITGKLNNVNKLKGQASIIEEENIDF